MSQRLTITITVDPETLTEKGVVPHLMRALIGQRAIVETGPYSLSGLVTSMEAGG